LISRDRGQGDANGLAEGTGDGLCGEGVGGIAGGDDAGGGAVDEIGALAEAVEVVGEAAAGLCVCDTGLRAVRVLPAVKGSSGRDGGDDGRECEEESGSAHVDEGDNDKLLREQQVYGVAGKDRRRVRK